VCSPQPFIVIKKCTGMECERRKQRAIVGRLNVCLGNVRGEEQYDVGWKRVEGRGNRTGHTDCRTEDTDFRARTR
jgi:hypothetical protein